MGSPTDLLSDDRLDFLIDLLKVILAKLRWEEDSDPDDSDDDDAVEFHKMRKDLRTFLDAAVVIDQEHSTGAVQSFAMRTFHDYSDGVPLPWNDAELGVYLVYIYGEICRCQYPLFP